MLDKFKPMLACECSDITQVKFPIMASSKLDGIRCTIFGGVAYSRSLKPIPNKFVQSWAKENAFAESGFNSRVTNQIGAFGTFQHLGSRKRDLFNYAKQRGLDPGDYKTQLDFAVHELNTSHRSANRRYNSASDAAVGIMNNFEKPSDAEKRKSVNKRIGFANKIAQYQKGGEYDLTQEQINELILKGYKFVLGLVS